MEEHDRLDHCGYKVDELYIKKRYQTFKEEILEYKHFKIGVIAAMEKINIKAAYYLETETTKTMKAEIRDESFWINPEHYGIDNWSDLGISNLFSLILYTDFTDLSSDFSRCFRKIYSFETFQNVKRRNSYYWWWSKILRETVELYGTTFDADARNTGLEGPFFTGLSFVMNIPQYGIKLNSPSSTSLHIEVATKFAGDGGIIIELDIGKSDFLMKELRGFDCSWISQYKEEDEMYVYVYF